VNNLNIGARAFIWGVIAAGTTTWALVVTRTHIPDSTTARLVIIFLIAAAVLADVFHIHLHYRVEVTISTAGNFAAMVLFGTGLACTTALVGSVLGDLLMRKSWYKTAFNAGNFVLSVAVAGLVYALVQTGGDAVPLSSAQNAAALAAAGICYLAVNAGLLCITVGLVEKHNPWQIYRANLRGMTFQLITLIPLGTLISIVYYQSPWGLVLLLFPILLAHYSFDSYQKLRSESKRTIELLAEALDRRDHYTFQHSQRVAYYAEAIARRAQLDLETVEAIVSAARVHDLGKIGTESTILQKPTRLEDHERRKIQEHPVIGAEIISALSLYDQVKDLIAYHQERWDGTGYPAGLKGEQIPLGARIIAIADAYEAMTSDRPYRRAMTREAAMAELKASSGTYFDPALVPVMLEVLEEERLGGLSFARADLATSHGG